MKPPPSESTLVDLDDPRWLAILGANPHDLFSSYRWCRAIADFYGFDAGAFLDARGGGLPYAIVDDHRGERFVAYPFSDACAPVGPFDLDLLAKDGTRSNRRWVVRGPARHASSVPAGVHQRIDLANDLGTLAERSRKHRKHLFRVRHALNAGVRIRVLDDPDAAVDAFYPLYSAFRKERLRLLPQSSSFFAHLARAYFPDDGAVVVAEFEGTVAGFAFFICHADTLYVKYSAVDSARASLGINNALIQHAIDLAYERRCGSFDMGLSTTEGLERFKESLGCEASAIYQNDFGPTAEPAGADAIRETIREITALSVAPELPLKAAQDAGAALYRFFA